MLGNNVKNMENWAFYGCSSLTSINFPKGLTTIGSWAFYECSSLTSISLPEGLTSIESRAFEGCSNLANISFPESLTKIGSWVFNGTLWYSKQPNGLIYAGKVALRWKGLMPSNTNVVLKEDTKAIADAVFSGCSEMVSITIPQSITHIGEYAFSSCTGLTSITLPNKVTSLGKSSFAYCSNLKAINIPENLTSIEEESFQNCSSLSSIDIPNSVTNIGSSAFSGCRSLTSVILPQPLTSIDSETFKDCSSLTSIALPENVKSIGSSAFAECENLVTIYLPKSLTTICKLAFAGCANLAAVNIKDLAAWCNIDFYENDPWNSGFYNTNPLAIAHHLFLNGEEVRDLVIPEVSRLNRYAFSGCTGLTTVIIPESVTTIGYGAFSGCSNLTSVTIPEHITSIGGMVFSNCSSLTSITIPESVTYIGSDALYKCTGLIYATVNCPTFNVGLQTCTSLKGITLGANVETIVNQVFKGINCNIRSQATTAPKANSNNLFDGWNGQYIFIPEGSLNSYLSTSPWNSLLKEKFVEGIALINTNISSVDYTSVKCDFNLITHFGDDYQFSEYGVVCNGKKYKVVEPSLLIENLLPGTEYVIAPYYIFDGQEYVSSKTQKVKTKMPTYNISFNQMTQTKIGGTMSVDENDITFEEYGVILKGESMSTDEYAKAEEGKLSISDLVPNTSYNTVPYFIYDGDTISINSSVRQVNTKNVSVSSNILSLTKTKVTGQLLPNFGDADNDKCRIRLSYKNGNSGVLRSITVQESEFSITDLFPEQKYNLICAVDYNINGQYKEIFSNITTFTTKGCDLSTFITLSPTAAEIKNEYDIDELEMVSEFYLLDGIQGNEKNLSLTGLEPLHQYSYTFTVVFSNGYQSTKTTQFTTQNLTFKSLQPKVISIGNVIIGAESNIVNEEEKVGFEWRRIDWTDEFDSNRGEAILFEGTMEGYIRNLYADKLWKFRPYYESASGNRYYGDWLGFDPTNTSYFEPTVHTYARAEVYGNTAQLKGYVMRGSDNVVQQGFMYWKTSPNSSEGGEKRAAAIPNEAMTIEAEGTVMTVELKDLDYESTYCYVAFVKTSENEMFYGEQQTLQTGIDTSGVEDVVAAPADVTEVARYDVRGRKLDAPQKGLNIIRMSNGTVRKVMVK